MLTFADSAWHVVSAALVFLFGLVLALLLSKIFAVGQRRALFFYLWHTAFCIAYFLFSLSNVADARSYFSNSIDPAAAPALGTAGITFLTSIFSQWAGFSYGGAFLVFNLFGFIGMLAFWSAMQQVIQPGGKPLRYLALSIILLPGLSFWSSAIGKDAISFMGAGLATWAALNLGRRYPAMALAALALLFVRPHMAGLLLASLALAMGLVWRGALWKRVVLGLVVLPAAIWSTDLALEYVGLGESQGIGEFTEYIESRQHHNLGGGSSVEIANMSLPMRVLTYTFRPLFFDAPGLSGIVISFENLFLVVVFLWALSARLRGGSLNIPGFAVSFYVIFGVISWVLLANTTANLGIAIRQKWMFLPMLLLVALACIASVRRRATVRRWATQQVAMERVSRLPSSGNFAG